METVPFKTVYKPVAPRDLTSLEPKVVESFLHKWKHFQAHYNENKVRISTYIEPSLWKKLQRRKKDIFKALNECVKNEEETTLQHGERFSEIQEECLRKLQDLP